MSCLYVLNDTRTHSIIPFLVSHRHWTSQHALEGASVELGIVVTSVSQCHHASKELCVPSSARRCPTCATSQVATLLHAIVRRADEPTAGIADCGIARSLSWGGRHAYTCRRHAGGPRLGSGSAMDGLSRSGATIYSQNVVVISSANSTTWSHLRFGFLLEAKQTCHYLLHGDKYRCAESISHGQCFSMASQLSKLLLYLG